MSVFLDCFGHRLFVEHARWATPGRFLSIRRDNGETLIWIGRLHVIHTPARWSPRPERRGDERPHPS